jgi:putative FmdB family regulatory protein
MPLYAFRCDDCHKEFETLVRSNEAPECPACGSAELSRQLSLIAKPATGGPGGEVATSASCAAMSGGAPCGAGCPAFGNG